MLKYCFLLLLVVFGQAFLSPPAQRTISKVETSTDLLEIKATSTKDVLDYTLSTGTDGLLIEFFYSAVSPSGTNATTNSTSGSSGTSPIGSSGSSGSSGLAGNASAPTGASGANGTSPSIGSGVGGTTSSGTSTGTAGMGFHTQAAGDNTTTGASGSSGTTTASGSSGTTTASGSSGTTGASGSSGTTGASSGTTNGTASSSSGLKNTTAITELHATFLLMELIEFIPGAANGTAGNASAPTGASGFNGTSPTIGSGNGGTTSSAAAGSASANGGTSFNPNTTQRIKATTIGAAGWTDIKIITDTTNPQTPIGTNGSSSLAANATSSGLGANSTANGTSSSAAGPGGMPQLLQPFSAGTGTTDGMFNFMAYWATRLVTVSNGFSLDTDGCKFDMNVTSFAYQQKNTRLAIHAQLGITKGLTAQRDTDEKSPNLDAFNFNSVTMSTGNIVARLIWENQVFDAQGKNYSLRVTDPIPATQTASSMNDGTDDLDFFDVFWVIDTDTQPTTFMWDPKLGVEYSQQSTGGTGGNGGNGGNGGSSGGAERVGVSVGALVLLLTVALGLQSS